MAIEKNNRSIVGWRLWFWWAVASTGGMLFGYLLPGFSTLSRTAIVVGLSFGVISGFLQWLVLQLYISYSYPWILTSVLGWTVAFAIREDVIIGYLFNGNAMFSLASLTLELLFIGVVAGASQWLILRQWSSWAGWWIPGNAVAWAVGMLSVGISRPSILSPLGFTLWGIFSGGIMLMLLRHPIHER